MRTPRAVTIVTLIASAAVVGVALDLPPVGPVDMPPPLARADPCSQPRTLREAHEILTQIVDPAWLKRFESGPESGALTLNDTLGPVLRNLWGLWNGSPLRRHLRAMGLTHPDDMSELVFVTFWRYLNDQPLRTEREVARLHAAEDWRPDLRCRCLATGTCSSRTVLDPRSVRSRAFWVADCCCGGRVPQIVEGTLSNGFVLPPPAMRFAEVVCVTGYARPH